MVDARSVLLVIRAESIERITSFILRQTVKIFVPEGQIETVVTFTGYPETIRNYPGLSGFHGGFSPEKSRPAFTDMSAPDGQLES